MKFWMLNDCNPCWYCILITIWQHFMFFFCTFQKPGTCLIMAFLAKWICLLSTQCLFSCIHLKKCWFFFFEVLFSNNWFLSLVYICTTVAHPVNDNVSSDCVFDCNITKMYFTQCCTETTRILQVLKILMLHHWPLKVASKNNKWM